MEEEEKEEKEKAMKILHTKVKAMNILDKVEGRGWLDWLLPLELLDREEEKKSEVKERMGKRLQQRFFEQGGEEDHPFR